MDTFQAFINFDVKMGFLVTGAYAFSAMVLGIHGLALLIGLYRSPEVEGTIPRSYVGLVGTVLFALGALLHLVWFALRVGTVSTVIGGLTFYDALSGLVLVGALTGIAASFRWRRIHLPILFLAILSTLIMVGFLNNPEARPEPGASVFFGAYAVIFLGLGLGAGSMGLAIISSRAFYRLRKGNYGMGVVARNARLGLDAHRIGCWAACAFVPAFTIGLFQAMNTDVGLTAWLGAQSGILALGILLIAHVRAAWDRPGTLSATYLAICGIGIAIVAMHPTMMWGA